MAAALRHRGPDGEGVHLSGPALLAHTRLAIVDLAGGDQPLFSEDRSCVAVVNGEIYNHLDLREELEALGHRFATHSDSEAIVHAYEEWGTGCLQRLNGIFAFVLWDSPAPAAAGRARPAGGQAALLVPPGHAARAGIRGRGARGGRRRAAGARPDGAGPLPRLALRAGSAHALRGRVQARPGLIPRGGRGRPCRVWRATARRPASRSRDATPDELAARLRAELVTAVTRQTMSDVPYAAFLSGGVDSAAIVAALRQGVEGTPSTFTIGFPGFGEDLDESGVAARTAAELGTDHHVDEHGRGGLPGQRGRRRGSSGGAVRQRLRPALLQLSRFTSRSVKVVLSGQGADEPLGGYRRAQAAAALGLVDWFPAAAGRGLAAAADLLPRSERAKRAAGVLATPAGLDRLLRVFEISTPSLRRELLRAQDPAAGLERRSIASGVLADVPGRDVLDQALYLDTHVFLPDHLLLYGDKMSMAHGLEHRVPFLDVELMRFVERIPARVRMRHAPRKWLYRKSMRGLVPESVLARPKRPFTTPYDQWLRTSLGGRDRARLRRRRGRDRARGSRAWSGGSWRSTGAVARTTSGCSTACSSSATGTARSSRGPAGPPR